MQVTSQVFPSHNKALAKQASTLTCKQQPEPLFGGLDRYEAASKARLERELKKAKDEVSGCRIGAGAGLAITIVSPLLIPASSFVGGILLAAGIFAVVYGSARTAVGHFQAKRLQKQLDELNR